MITFQPLRNGILLDLEPSPEKSPIIAVQQQTEDLIRFGVIKAVGPEVRDAKVGQRVLASIVAGSEVPGGHLVAETAILGLVA